MKLLVAVMTCHALDYFVDDQTQDYLVQKGWRCLDQQARVNAQRETWLTALPEGVDYKFFYGTKLRDTISKPNQRRPSPQPQLRSALEDEIFLPCGDQYTANSQKMKAICQWALDFGYDYILRVDDDTFIFPEKLLATDFAEFPYSGATTNTFHPGSCVFLSREAMQIIVDKPAVSTCDDLSVGHVLLQSGILPHSIHSIRHAFGDGYRATLADAKNFSSLHSCTPELMRSLWTLRTTALSAQQKDTAGAASKTTLSPSPNQASEDAKSSSSVTSPTPLVEHLQNSDLNSSITKALETTPSSNDSASYETGSVQTSLTSASSSTATLET